MNRVRFWLRKWLGITDWAENIIELKEHLDRNLKGFDENLRKFAEVECTVCYKLIVTYPLGGGYYREFDGDVICSSECLDAKKSAQPKSGEPK